MFTPMLKSIIGFYRRNRIAWADHLMGNERDCLYAEIPLKMGGDQGVRLHHESFHPNAPANFWFITGKGIIERFARQAGEQ